MSDYVIVDLDAVALAAARRIVEIGSHIGRPEVQRLAQIQNEVRAVIDLICSGPSAAEKERDEAREALKEVEEVFAPLECIPPEDKTHLPAVEALGERIGYGALMACAQLAWRRSAFAKGDPVGGEFVAGPCYATVLATLETIRAALGGE